MVNSIRRYIGTLSENTVSHTSYAFQFLYLIYFLLPNSTEKSFYAHWYIITDNFIVQMVEHKYVGVHYHELKINFISLILITPFNLFKHQQ